MLMSFFGNDAHPAQHARQIKLGARRGSETGDGSSSPNRPRVVVSFEELTAPPQGRRASTRSGNNNMLGASNLSGGQDASFNNLSASFNPNKTASFEDLQRRMNEESMLSLKTALEPEGANMDTNATDASAARQQFLSNQRRMQRACHWGVIVQVSCFLNATITGLNVTKAQAEARDQMNPRCLLGIRRAIRRMRLRMLAPTMTKPAVASVRNDKMLGLFSEAHIQFLVDNLEPRYFFAREGIIFMGSEDDECYVLFSGSADVMMGKIKVFTMTGGMVFGSVGMISGEPRTATILARENCLVWSISRRAFESYGARDHQVAAAQTIIRELRQKNIRSVYKGLIEPDYLSSRFTMLKGCSQEGVTMLLAKSEPRVLKSGEVLLHPPSPDSELGRPRRSPYEVRPPGEPDDDADDLALPTSMDVLYILRGTVRIYRNIIGQLSQEKCLEEHLTFMLELASKRHPGSEEDTISAAAKAYEMNVATFDPTANRADREVVPNQN
ncbi:cyclic nucleotide-binding protein, putative, partial [Bodo saltans]